MKGFEPFPERLPFRAESRTNVPNLLTRIANWSNIGIYANVGIPPNALTFTRGESQCLSPCVR